MEITNEAEINRNEIDKNNKKNRNSYKKLDTQYNWEFGKMSKLKVRYK